MEISLVLAGKVFVSAAVIASLVDMYSMQQLKDFTQWSGNSVGFPLDSLSGKNGRGTSMQRLVRAIVGERTIAFMRTRTMFFPTYELLFGVLVTASLFLHRTGVDFIRAALFLSLAVPIALVAWLDPDGHSVPSFAVGIGTATGLVSSLMPGSIGWKSSLLGASVSGGFFLLLYYFGRILFREEAMGMGNVFVATMIGAFCGFPQVSLALSFGMAVAGVWGAVLLLSRRASSTDAVPYVSFILFGGVVGMLLWQWLPAST